MAEKKKSKADADGVIAIAENRRARFDFEIGETLECGIELVGAEVKSLRNKAVSFADAFADIANDQLYLHNVKIDRYRQSTVDVVEPSRKRRLLANAKEIEKFRRLVQERGFTRDELYTADEIFLSGTAAELTPVREVDDRRIGSGRPGEITTLISKTFFDIVRGGHPSHPEWRYAYSSEA
jgi:SsrA-binding protein